MSSILEGLNLPWSSPWVTVVIATVIALYVYGYRLHHPVWSQTPDGPKRRPLLGHLLSVGVRWKDLRRGIEYAEVMKEGIYTMWLGPHPSLTVYYPQTVKPVLQAAAEMTSKGSFYKYIMPWLGDGLLVSQGKKWRSRRRMLTPAFHFDILKHYCDIMNRHSSALVGKWNEKHAVANGSDSPTHDSERFGIKEDISLATLDVINETAMGYKPDSLHNSESAYVVATKQMSRLFVHRTMNPLVWPAWMYNLTWSGYKFRKCCRIVHGESERIIRARQAELATSGLQKDRKLDFLDLLLAATDEDGTPLSDTDILDEVHTFMFEGHDTTAHGIMWTLYLLSTHPEVQQKVYDEVMSVAGETGDIPYASLSSLVYLGKVIKESNRLYPPVPIIARTVAEPLEVAGRVYPRGSDIIINIWALQRCQAVWGPDSEEFKPEREGPADPNHPDSAFAQVPFSAGPRNCIGQKFAQMEMKVMIARLVREFVIRGHDDGDLWPEPSVAVVLQCYNDITISLERRRPA